MKSDKAGNPRKSSLWRSDAGKLSIHIFRVFESEDSLSISMQDL